MTDKIRNNARALVKSLVAIENEPDDDEQDAVIARQVADTFIRWDAEHPGEDGTIHVERDDEGGLTVTVTQKK